MKRLAVLRHAKSSWADPGMADFDRPVNDRGRQAARGGGREKARRRMQFYLLLDGVQRKFAFEREVRFEPRIYDASVATLFDLIRAIPENSQSALLVGHNPGLHELVLDLTDPDEAGLRDRLRGKYPTAALAVIELAPAHWAEVGPGSGRIVELVLPRDLAD